jgi:hypothetical protein
LARVLLLGSLLDAPTVVSSDFLLRFARWAEGAGHQVFRLIGLGATRLPLRLALLQPFDLVFYAGHGLADQYVGNELLLGLVRAGDNSDWLRGKVVAGVPVCDSARRLGPDLLDRGALAFFGSRDVMWAAFPEAERDYLRDFMETWFSLPRAILEDRPMGECLDVYRASCTEFIELYEGSLGELPNGDWYLEKLTLNRDNYVLLGPSDLRLSDVAARPPAERSLGFGADWRDLVLSLALPVGAVVVGSVAAPMVLDAVGMRREAEAVRGARKAFLGF